LRSPGLRQIGRGEWWFFRMCRHRRCWSSSMVCIMSTPIPHARTSKSSCFSRVRRDRTRTRGASRGWRTVHLGRFGAVNCVSRTEAKREGTINCKQVKRSISIVDFRNSRSPGPFDLKSLHCWPP
jgi:hypothetical protein